MVSINTFLKSNNSIQFIDKDTALEYSKGELDADFQFYQESGSVTIQEYIDNLKEFLSKFKITKNKKGD